MKGAFIVIEGGDGAGKGTQSKLLVERLAAAGRAVVGMSFPRYGQASAVMVEKFLRGEFGAPADVSPYAISSYYAIDRYAAASEIRAHLEAGTAVIADRYWMSNLAYQSIKLPEAERASFIAWLDDYEYVRLGIPRPDLTLVIGAPVAARNRNVLKKVKRAYLEGAKQDVNEKDLAMQERVEAAYRYYAARLPNHILIDCTTPDGTLHPATICHDLVWNQIAWAFFNAETPARMGIL